MELNGIKTAAFEKVQEFIVGNDSGVIGPGGHDPPDGGRDPRGAEVAQHADPLVALLDVEIAQVLIALDGIPDAYVPQVRGAQVHPLAGELGLGIQQGEKAGREGGDPPGGFGAQDPLGRDLQHPQVLDGVCAAVRQNFIQHRGIGGLPLGG